MVEILALGECMVEFFCDGPIAEAVTFTKSFGGDTLNTLAAASRLGSATGYLTRVGSDPFGAYLLEAWQRERIDTARVRQVSGSNGVYFISLLAGGVREFTYYRTGSAATTMTPDDVPEEVFAGARLLHISGISQAISPSARATVLAAVQRARAAGVLVSYDPNYRPRLWSSEEDARAAFDEVLPYTNIILPSVPEELTVLIGAPTPEESIARLIDRGVETVAVKAGSAGAVVGTRNQPQPVTIPSFKVQAVDTTGAGDAFNGGFLHGLLTGLPPTAAAALGVVTAGLKVRGRGAIASLPDRAETYAAWREHLQSNKLQMLNIIGQLN